MIVGSSLEERQQREHCSFPKHPGLDHNLVSDGNSLPRMRKNPWRVSRMRQKRRGHNMPLRCSHLNLSFGGLVASFGGLIALFGGLIASFVGISASFGGLIALSSLTESSAMSSDPGKEMAS